MINAIIQYNITIFSRLHFVDYAVCFDDPGLLSEQLKKVSDFYLGFCIKLNFLPTETVKDDYSGLFKLGSKSSASRTTDQVLRMLSKNSTVQDEILPVHLKYADGRELHLVAGLAKRLDKNSSFLYLADVRLPKELISMVPARLNYLIELAETYSPNATISLSDFVKSQGYNYRQFQKDCHALFGDSFYAFMLKKRMMGAAGNIIFTGLSKKEIAVMNEFDGYLNMYRTFTRYGVETTNIPRLVLVKT